MDIITMATDKIRDIRCDFCFRSSAEKLLNRFSQADNDSIAKHVDSLLANQDLSSPQLQQQLADIFSKLTEAGDLFAEEKKLSNQIGKRLYEQWKMKLKTVKKPEMSALRLAVAANTIDYGAANHTIDVDTAIENVLKTNFAIDHSQELMHAIQNADKILYLCDNAGEIYFDRLLMEVLELKDITIAVRGAPILNDALMEDAVEAELHQFGKLISNGSSAPSTILSDCSAEFLQEYQKADLIISKGMGNLEGLYFEKNPKIFFLLMTKCEVIAELLQVPKGSFVVAHSKKLWN